MLRKEGSVATQTKTRTARSTANETGAARKNGDGAIIAATDLQPLLEALRSGARGESGARDARVSRLEEAGVSTRL